MKYIASLILKIIGVALCGLTTLGGVLALFADSSTELDVFELSMTLVFLIFTILLIRSIRKSRRAKSRTVNTTPVTYTYQPKNGSELSASIASKKPHPTNCTATTAIATQDSGPIDAPTENQLLSLSRRIPEEIFQLLWFVNGPCQNYFKQTQEADFDFMGFSVRIGGGSLGGDPSAIDIELPLSSVPAAPPPLEYYPSYNALSPQQRTAYLTWLMDITVPIDIGYVFIFYYGLERHLFFGNAEAALAAIFILRNFHNNSSFQTYSTDAILIYSLAHNRPEILKNLDAQYLSPGVRLFVSGICQHRLTAMDIMAAHKKFSFENARYIKAEPQLFQDTLIDKLREEFGADEFAVALSDFQSATGAFTLALANYSLLPSQRFVVLPDISTSPKVHKTINRMLTETHETVKIKLRELRKQAKKEASPGQGG